MPDSFPRLETEGLDTGVAHERAGVDRATAAHRLAALVLAEMREHAILPTPRNYDLWFTFRADMNPALTQRVRLALDERQALTPAVLDTLYGECVAGAEVNVDAIGCQSQAIQDAAQTLIDQVASNQAAVASYGDTLADWAQHLGDQPTLAVLVDAVASITAETMRAGERNRLLEQQLSASAARIARLRHSLAEVRQEATTDALTGLANRRAFDARIKRLLAQLRSEPGTPLTLLLVDVDHFKRFNDTHGHRVGDLVLRLVARLMADNVKGRDTVARYGGEEFAILLAGADLRAACVVARQLGEALSSKRLVTRGSTHPIGSVTVSIGVAQARPGEQAACLVERADNALYEAKRTGRNRVCTELAGSGSEPAVLAMLG